MLASGKMGDPTMRLALFATLATTPAFADARTYVGMLGDRAILAELTEPEDGAIVGRFTYIDDGADVPLQHITAEEGLWVVTEEGPCTAGTCLEGEEGIVLGGPIAATWRLDVSEDRSTLTGQREVFGDKVKDEPLPIALTFVASREVESDEISPDALHYHSAELASDPSMSFDDAPYELELLDVRLEPGEIIETNGMHWTYVTEPRSGLTFPRVVPMTLEAGMLGAAMDLHFYRMSLSALDCKAFRYAAYGMSEFFLGMGGHTAGYEDEQITLTYLSPTLASWSQEGSLYCQGAHPYNHLDNYTIEASTGERLDWRKVFSAIVPRPWFSPPEEVVDVETALAEPDSYTWGPSLELIGFVRQNSPEELFEGEAELAEMCFSDQAIAEQLSMRVVGDGEIMFSLSGFPHVASVCNTDLFSAPLGDLAPFLAETASDYFPVLGAKPQQ